MSNSVDKSRFSLFVCGGFMDGWSRKTCPRWFTAVCGGRSAGSDGVMHAFLGSVQNGSGTQTSTPKRRHVAAVPAAAENTCRGHTPTCQRPSVFAFLQRIWICGKTSNIHAPSLQMCYTPCSSYDCRCFVSSSRGAGPSSLQQGRAAALDPHQEKTEDLHTEPYSVNQWPTNLHTPCDCFLSHYLFGRSLISTQSAAQQPPPACTVSLQPLSLAVCRLRTWTGRFT